MGDSGSHSSSSNNVNHEIVRKEQINGWNEHNEEIFFEWADKAMCYRWLHSRSFNIFSSRAARYTIPVIIMSTITGTANFAQDKFPEEYKVLAQMAIGTINIIAGILTTIAQYYKINELNEAHRISSISWSKFYQNIKVEMAKHPKERKSPNDMLNSYKEEFDRLLEISPNIEDKVVAEFKHRFGKKDKGLYSSKEVKDKYQDEMNKVLINEQLDPNTRDKSVGKLFDDYLAEMNKVKKGKSKNQLEFLKKPDICDELISISEGKRDWYSVTDNKDEGITYEVSPEMLKETEKRKAEEIYRSQINIFIDEYHKLKGQYPLLEDIIDNKKDSIPLESLREISISILKKCFDGTDNNV
uniref:SMODS and SLOG-associating 2TM effector domain-containing protein n=1 Tax=viral metagenome TaxID=1070528 RepID=A0A6C0EH01_9ZZZZ